MAEQQQAPERLPFPGDVTTHMNSRPTGWVWAGLLLAVAGGLGYYSFTLHQARGGLEQALATARVQVDKQDAEGKLLRERLLSADAERAEHQALLAATNEKLQSASAELAATHTRLDELDAERGQIKEQLADFKQMTTELARMIDSGRLNVSFRRGRMIVELPAQVLFASGSADLTEEGKLAMAEVAKSLRGFKSRNFIVAGHTDNVPVSGRFANNWELSSARSVTVTGALIRGGLEPAQLVAAGYGEHDPIARNVSEAGKQKNRRIEIILEPRLRELNLAKVDPKLAKPEPKLAKANAKKSGLASTR